MCCACTIFTFFFFQSKTLTISKRQAQYSLLWYRVKNTCHKSTEIYYLEKVESGIWTTVLGKSAVPNKLSVQKTCCDRNLSIRHGVQLCVSASRWWRDVDEVKGSLHLGEDLEGMEQLNLISDSGFISRPCTNTERLKSNIQAELLISPIHGHEASSICLVILRILWN